jgi:hypothetical protein
MPMTLVHRPRSPRRMHAEVQNEIKRAYNVLADEIVNILTNDVQNWNDKPQFSKRVSINQRNWIIVIDYDRDSEIGKIYTWVDKGTGARGGGQEYDIFPVNADALHFTVPSQPKTTSGIIGIPGIVLQDAVADFEDVYTQHVVHPGIEPRNFTESLKKQMSNRTRPGSLRSVTEAAIKRSYRRIGI